MSEEPAKYQVNQPTPDVPHGLFKAAFDWIESAPHGDNCFVSDNYEGDPGNQCNCGKDSLLSAYEEFGQAEAPAVAQEPVVQRTLGYEQGIQDAAKMLDTKANDYAKEFGFDDMGALEFSRETQRDYHSTLIELAEEVRSMEATNLELVVAQPPAEVVRELVEQLQRMVDFVTTGLEVKEDHPYVEMACATLTKAKEHGL